MILIILAFVIGIFSMLGLILFYTKYAEVGYYLMLIAMVLLVVGLIIIGRMYLIM